MALLAGAPTKNDAERMFKAARNAELVDGDLKGAIKQYDAIVAKFGQTHRDVAADALVRMAECHTKLGNAEARKIYARVIKDYSDQKEAVAVAQARLANGNPDESAKGDRVIWAGENATHVGGSISPDGRFVSYTDWWYTGNLMLHDLASGTDRPLTPNKDWRGEGNALSSAFSSDGKQLAYGWTNYEPTPYGNSHCKHRGNRRPATPSSVRERRCQSPVGDRLVFRREMDRSALSA